jgi:hypothetical protein
VKSVWRRAFGRGGEPRTGVRIHRALPLALAVPLAAAVLLATLGFATASCGSGVQQAGRAAPDFAGTTIEGVDVSLSEYKGKPLVLAFMASW